MHLSQELKPIKPLHTRLVLFFMFVAFGLTIALVSFFFSSYLHTKALRQQISQDAYIELQEKQELLREQSQKHVSTLMAARQCDFFTRYLAQRVDEQLRRGAEQCMLAVANAQPEIVQLRYLDEKGMERIRINKTGAYSPGYVLPVGKLQDKSGRYYSQQLAQEPDRKIWYSNVDLNIEQGQITRPLQPVLRIATPLYDQGRYQGFIIVNLLMQSTLEQLLESKLFDVLISNGDGHLLVRSEGPNNRIKHIWSGYLGSSQKLQQVWPDIARQVLRSKAPLEQNNRFSLSLNSALPNQQNLLLLLEPKPSQLLQLQSQEQQYLFLVTLAIIGCSLLLGLSFSSMLLHLNRKLLAAQNALAQQMDIVDRYVPITRTDTEGVITSASQAFYHLSGYQPSDLIGRSHRICRHEDTPSSLYADLWHCLRADKVWSGEIKNKRRDGMPLWLSLRITPDHDEKNAVCGFMAIGQDITAQKLLEQQALTDPLTGLYNRRHFDATFARELNRCVREGLPLGLALIDADHFKQYNDHFGHEAGDQVLKSIALSLSQGLQRATDFAFRIGGEEFAILFSALNRQQATHLLDGVRNDLLSQQIAHPGNPPLGIVSISIGVTILHPDRDTRPFDLFETADQALYRAKDSGRNCICFSIDQEPPEEENGGEK